ncbi:hypothetical protein GF325_06355, partial [Candidatus Bathyarchaeota archaeon]|nr:hypothetical protein [Candidatus Bathyarchaeota archaeon]
SDTIDVESIVQEIHEAGKQVHKRTVTIALNRFRQAPTHDYFFSSEIGSRLKDLLDVTFGKRCMRSMEENGTPVPSIFKIACAISRELIKFVSLLEGVLASLWTAPKHPVRSGYVITFSILEPLDEYNMLVEEIANHPGMETQLAEWRALGIIGENISPNDILLQSLFGMRVKDEYSHLPIDTRHFKNLETRIVSSFDDLDSSLDGWLVKGDNFQVLTSMASKFKGRVQMVYIDPPFNKGEDSGYRYSVDYTDSVWLTMLQDRLTVVKDYLETTGNMFVRCDYRGTLGLRYLLDDIFGASQYRNEIAVGRTKGKKQTTTSLPNIKDTLFLYGASKKNRLNEVMIETQEAATVHKVGNFLKRSKTLRELDIASRVDRLADEMLWVPLDHRPGERKSTRDRVLFGRTFPPPPNRHWIKTQDRIQELGKAGKARIRCKCGVVHQDGDGPWKGCPKCSGKNQRIEIHLDEEPLTDVWSDISGYAQTWGFPTENTEGMLRRAILAGSNEGDIVMDFFLGSGTAVATAHKLGRRWIGIEMGKHFHDIILPRMKKVLSGHDSGISTDITARKGGFFKYMEVPTFAAFCDCIALNRDRVGDVVDSVGAGKDIDAIESLLELKEAGTVEPSPFEDIDVLEYITWKEGKLAKCINEEVVELESGETKQVTSVDPLSILQEFMNR